MANEVKFKRGLLANLPTTAADGTLYITTDEGGIYLGVGTTMKRLGDIVLVDSISALPSTGVATNALYYAVSENVLARYNGTKWIQINAAGLTKVNTSGSGNAFTSASVAANSTTGAMELTLTKGETFATKAAQDATAESLAALTTRVAATETALGTDSGDGSVASRIETLRQTLLGAATASQSNYDSINDLADALVALQGTVSTQGTNLSTLSNTVSTNSDNIATISGDYLKAADKTALQSQITTNKNNISSNATAISTNAGNIATNTSNISSLQSSVSSQAEDISGLKTRVSTAESAITTLNGSATTKGSVAYQVAAGVASVVAGADASYDTLKEIADWIKNDTTGAAKMANDISSLKTSMTTANSNISDNASAISALTTTVSTNKTVAETAVSNLETKLVGTATDYKTLGALETAVKAAATSASTGITNAAAAQTTANKAAEDLASEITRAKAAEKTNADNITAEVTRAKAAEKTNADNITALGTRMTTAEGNITTNASNIATNAESISALQTQLTWGTF